MIAYVAKSINSLVAGRQLRQVDCEKCGAEYYYELVRVGMGQASAPYYVGQKWAAKRAERAAERAVAKRLACESEMVPCPKCNWVSASMVERYRRRRYGTGWVMMIVLLTALGLLGVPVIVTVEEGPRGPRPGDVRPYVMAAAYTSPLILSAVWVLAIRSMLRQRIDPNRTFPSAPLLPPGTPPAMVRRTDPRTGEERLEAVPQQVRAEEEELRPGQVGGEWVTYRAGQVAFPAACCVCTGAPTTTYSVPFKVSEADEVNVPLCRGCARGLKLKWWVIALAAAGVVAGVLAIVAWGGVVKADATGRAILFTIGCVFGVPVAVAIVPAMLCKPYRIKVVDGDRGIFRLTATNPEFVRAMRKQVREAEGRA
ncbi:MAG TPA: hypothetical protein VEA69_08585 [Tepidisphaeraceae bacterium]|nr:hypothetical protein [Tepidisphaeraceae bacterium]